MCSTNGHCALAVLQVRGVPALRSFSTSFLTPFEAPPPRQIGSAREAELEAEVFKLREQVAELQAQLATK